MLFTTLRFPEVLWWLTTWNSLFMCPWCSRHRVLEIRYSSRQFCVIQPWFVRNLSVRSIIPLCLICSFLGRGNQIFPRENIPDWDNEVCISMVLVVSSNRYLYPDLVFCITSVAGDDPLCLCGGIPWTKKLRSVCSEPLAIEGLECSLAYFSCCQKFWSSRVCLPGTFNFIFPILFKHKKARPMNSESGFCLWVDELVERLDIFSQLIGY